MNPNTFVPDVSLVAGAEPYADQPLGVGSPVGLGAMQAGRAGVGSQWENAVAQSSTNQLDALSDVGLTGKSSVFSRSDGAVVSPNAIAGFLQQSAEPEPIQISPLAAAIIEEDVLTGGAFSGGLVSADRTDYPGYVLRYMPGQSLEDRPAVAQWQRQMQSLGKRLSVDGLFGPESERVAMLFQAEKGLAVDGIVGEQTWRAAFDASVVVLPEPPAIDSVVLGRENPYPGRQFSYSPLVPLQFDDQVQDYQQRLKDLGWQLSVDGFFGRESEAITEKFQRQVTLDSDGVVGELTWAALFSEDAPDAPVQQTFDRSAASGRINTAGLNLIKDFEGLRLNAYQDAVGVWTIGYGHTNTAYPGQRITNAQATDLLRGDVANFENAVTRAVRVPITENQFAALVSFAYNVGSGALNSSTLLRRLNAGDTLGAANELLRWNRAGGRVLAGLTRRREAERALFLLS